MPSPASGRTNRSAYLYSISELGAEGSYTLLHLSMALQRLIAEALAAFAPQRVLTVGGQHAFRSIAVQALQERVQAVIICISQSITVILKQWAGCQPITYIVLLLLLLLLRMAAGPL